MYTIGIINFVDVDIDTVAFPSEELEIMTRDSVCCGGDCSVFFEGMTGEALHYRIFSKERSLMINKPLIDQILLLIGCHLDVVKHVIILCRTRNPILPMITRLISATFLILPMQTRIQGLYRQSHSLAINHRRWKQSSTMRAIASNGSNHQ